MIRNPRSGRGTVAFATTVLLVLGGFGTSAQATSNEKHSSVSKNDPQRSEPQQKKDTKDTKNTVYFVHGYDASGGLNCAEYWGNALDEFNGIGWHGPLRTVGFYADDANCDVTVGRDKQVSTDTRITRIAANFANFVHENNTKNGEPVDIVAHSMGGIIARVALLGSAQGWPGFPQEQIRVGNVVTLGTPHGGLHCDFAPEDCEDDQLREQSPGSELIEILHAPQNQLDQDWSRDTDWHFVGSDEDDIVDGDSGIYEGFYADQKYRYLSGGAEPVTHGAVHNATEGEFRLRAWDPRSDSVRVRDKAPSPLGLAYRGVSRTTAPPDVWASFVAMLNPLDQNSRVAEDQAQ